MDAIILAAGFGSRLQGRGPSKPLVEVCGLPLLEISIRQLALSGASRIVVVTGHEAERVEERLGQLADDIGIPAESVRVEDPALPNGYSVVAGAKAVGEEFLLVMADHVLSTSILSGLIDVRTDNLGATLAIDRRVDHPALDPEDATWVGLGEGDLIRAIGKQLSNYVGVDCGAFLATQELPGAIHTAIEQGRPGSLSDGMQVLADAGRARAMDIGDAWWIDVDDLRSHAIAEQEIAASLPELFALQGVAAEIAR